MKNLIGMLSLLLSYLLVTSPVFGEDIVGIGYGNSEKIAKKEALADLSQAILSEVQSEFTSQVEDMKGDIKKYASKVIKVKSSLPILGPVFTLLPNKNEIMAEARFSIENAKSLYMERLKQLKSEIVNSVVLSKNTKDDLSKHETLTDLLSLIDQFYRYKTVAVMIGCKETPAIEIAEAEVKIELRTLEKNKINSIDLAAKIITKGMDKEGIYIYPPTAKGASEITSFGSITKDKIGALLKTVTSPKEAGYFLRGEYESIKDGISLTVSLINTSDFTVVKTGIVSLSPEAYKDYETEPATVDFDKLLHTGIIVSSDFRVEISTNQGKQDLLFKEGEKIELLVKMNQPGYFYIVGQIFREKQKFSYLVELNNAPEKRKFVYYVNGDEMNKWVSLGKFKVEPPFGVESLQVLASNIDLIDKLPNTQLKDTYYKISETPEKGVVNTRGLMKIKSEKDRASEAVLMFTSLNNAKKGNLEK